MLFNISEENLNVIVNSLVEQPYKVAQPVLEEFQKQIETFKEAQQKVKEEQEFEPVEE